jgi:hypothetical protein
MEFWKGIRGYEAGISRIGLMPEQRYSCKWASRNRTRLARFSVQRSTIEVTWRTQLGYMVIIFISYTVRICCIIEYYLFYINCYVSNIYVYELNKMLEHDSLSFADYRRMHAQFVCSCLSKEMKHRFIETGSSLKLVSIYG